MHHYEVRDVMAAEPVTVTPATPLKDIVDILVSLRAAALPVVTAAGRLVGVVSETDLLRKEQLQRDADSPHARHLTYRARRDLATAETAGEIMSTHLVTVRPDAVAAEAARLMDRHQVGALMVIAENGKLLGVVSRRDLLRVFLRPDEEIKAEIVNEFLVRYLGTNPAMMHVEVTDGVVRLTGEVERKSMLALIVPAVRAVDGVIDVESQLGYTIDDSIRAATPEYDEREMFTANHGPLAARRLK